MGVPVLSKRKNADVPDKINYAQCLKPTHE